MNKFLDGLTNAVNYGYTENGAVKHLSTRSDLLDMFAMGAAMRKRSDADVILMFRKAFEENPTYALKCLFYIRDVRGGQGERRFFRVVMKDLATWNPAAARRNLMNVPEYGRWDDLYVFINTPLQKDALDIMKNQLALDIECKTPSLLAKWLKSENTSSEDSRKLAKITRKHFGMTAKQYRKTLSLLRVRINVLERLMSENRWDEIEFDKIPSKAGMIYKNAFARHDLERQKSEKNVQTYADFAKDTTKKVNAKTLYPAEIVAEATRIMANECDYYYYNRNKPTPMDDINRLMVNKYWNNLDNYLKDAIFNGICVCDTSGSMTWEGDKVRPIDVAISLSLYCAERITGPFTGHYISFSRTPQLIKTEGVDFCDKVARIYRTNLCENTNIEATFDMLLRTAIENNCSQEDIPSNLIIISDMEFDQARGVRNSCGYATLMEAIEKKWNSYGYRMPTLCFWNVNARSNNIPMEAKDGITFISGYSPSVFDMVIKGKNPYSLMMDVLNKERYKAVH